MSELGQDVAATANWQNRSPIEHRVKSWPELFEAALCGAKKHDLR